MDVVLIEKGILTGLVQITLSWDTDNTHSHTAILPIVWGDKTLWFWLPFHLLKVNSVF